MKKLVLLFCAIAVLLMIAGCADRIEKVPEMNSSIETPDSHVLDTESQPNSSSSNDLYPLTEAKDTSDSSAVSKPEPEAQSTPEKEDPESVKSDAESNDFVVYQSFEDVPFLNLSIDSECAWKGVLLKDGESWRSAPNSCGFEGTVITDGEVLICKILFDVYEPDDFYWMVFPIDTDYDVWLLPDETEGKNILRAEEQTLYFEDEIVCTVKNPHKIAKTEVF